MTANSIFTTEVPAGHNFFDNGPLTLSTTFYSTVDTLVDAAQWWAPSNPAVGGETYELVLYKSTAEDAGGSPAGDPVAAVSVPIGSVPLDAWTGWKPFAALQQIEAYHAYKIGLRTSLGRYTATNNFFLSSGLTHGEIVSPQTSILIPAIGGTFYNGSYATDITSYPTHVNAGASYFVDVRTVDFATATGPLLVRSVHAATHANNTTPVSVTITPADGDIVVIKSQAWDWSISMAITNNGGLGFTRQVNGNASGFYPWVGIDTAQVSGSPGKITLEMTPSATCWHGMTVEVWRNAVLGSSVLNAVGASPLSASMSATAGSQISWVGGDSQSRDPALGTYLSGSVEEFLDDGHSGSNSVTYYALHTVTSTGSNTFGVSNPSAFSGKIAGIEIKAATGGGTTPVSQSLSTPWALRGGVSRSLDTPWAQRVSVARSVSTPWNLRRKVTSTLVTPWTVQGVLSVTARPSIGAAQLTGHVTAYAPEQITAYL